MKTHTIRTALFWLIVAVPVAQGQATQGNPPQPPQGNPPQQPAKSRYSQDTPESAFKSLLVAMAVGDEPALRKLAMPVPAEDFAFLLKDDRIPPAHVAEFRRAIEEQFTPKRLKPGDEVKLPNGRVLKIAPEEVTEDRAVILPPGPPLPMFAYRVMGEWKLDARPIIAGLKAADVARRAAEAKKKGGN